MRRLRMLNIVVLPETSLSAWCVVTPWESASPNVAQRGRWVNRMQKIVSIRYRMPRRRPVRGARNARSGDVSAGTPSRAHTSRSSTTRERRGEHGAQPRRRGVARTEFRAVPVGVREVVQRGALRPRRRRRRAARTSRRRPGGRARRGSRRRARPAAPTSPRRRERCTPIPRHSSTSIHHQPAELEHVGSLVRPPADRAALHPPRRQVVARRRPRWWSRRPRPCTRGASARRGSARRTRR